MSGDEPESSETENLKQPDSAPSSQQDFSPGSVLKERYLVEKELGRGGLGVVFLARDQQLHSRPVAIKILQPAYEETEDGKWARRKFMHEMEALARLDHPGIVNLFDTGLLPDGKLFIVMQFIEGATLRSIIKPDGIQLEHAAFLIRQIGQALSAAHDKGIYHRDLKPENIIIQTLPDGEHQVKLIDFGLAKVDHSQLASSTNSSRIAGTVAYMAPEQLMGQTSTASDIYAFALIAYELVAGRRPFNPEFAFQLYDLQRAGVKIQPRDLRPGLPDTANEIILKALSFDQMHRPRRARDFGEDLSRALINAPQELIGHRHTTVRSLPSAEARPGAEATIPSTASWVSITPQPSKQVALLYRRNAQPDEYVLKLLEAGLVLGGRQVFIDRHLSIGVEWAREIERQVRSSDAVVCLLSASSVQSEMLAYEVQIAHDEAQKSQGRPRLLPVRINYEGALPPPLSSILDPLQYATWNSPQDDQRLVAELLTSLENPQRIQPGTGPRKIEPTGGAVPLDSEFYIVRTTDEEFYSAIARQDSIVLVKGARQIGKTSLLARGLQKARKAGAKVALTDFQMLNSAHLESVETLFLTLAEMLADQLNLDVFPEDVWNKSRGASINFGRYIRREVMDKIKAPLVWGLDEVDRLFTCPFGSEVFGLFRSWHNARSLDPTGPWHQLTLAIAYATEAHLFITDINQSPFNVGTRLELEDFSSEQVAELNRRYGSPLEEATQVNRFMALLNGHPYLVRRSLQEMVNRNLRLTAFEAIADRDEGPLGDHLRRMLILLAQDPALCDIVRGVLQGNPCPTPESFYRLRSAGLITGTSARDAQMRCQLYSMYLSRHLL